MYPLNGGLETAEGGSEGYKWEPAGLSEAAHCSSSSLPQNLTIVFLLRLQPGIAPDFTAPHIMDWPVSQIQYLVPGLNSSNTLFDLQHHCLLATVRCAASQTYYGFPNLNQGQL